MGMMTDGHWWSDRVEQPSDILQRERLGGIALVRGQYWPGNLVSWRFAEAGLRRTWRCWSAMMRRATSA
jgi:hypothetical protein